MPEFAPVARALLSVSDKTGLVDLARGLAAHGVALVSTGGSARALAEAGLEVTEVAEVTGFPEILDGRVKTLHPKIHGGILARRDAAAHARALAEHAIAPIDLVAVNLYPFEETVAGGAGFTDAIENIDIGGPALIRAAAKNHAHVTVLVDPEDYADVLAELEAEGGTSEATRRRLAAKAFARTAAYDAAVAEWWSGQQGEALPARQTLAGRLAQPLRYGENPHQAGALYATHGAGIPAARQVQGKELSYNNIADADAALALIADLGDAAPTVAVIKHANPCGVARGASLAEAHARAVACDSVSAFGGIVAASRPLDRAAAEAIVGLFTEVVVAPGADEAALAVLAARRDLRLLLVDGLPDPAAPGRAVRSIEGGFLVQDRDAARITAGDLSVVSKRSPTPDEIVDLVFAFRIAKHVKSNAIVFAHDSATVGIGAGQMSRVDSVRIAALKAEDGATASGAHAPLTRGSVVASDAFYPFPDALEAAIAAGATAAIQPGGSRNDAAVIAAADAAGVAMVFTGIRHFRH